MGTTPKGATPKAKPGEDVTGDTAERPRAPDDLRDALRDTEDTRAKPAPPAVDIDALVAQRARDLVAEMLPQIKTEIALELQGKQVQGAGPGDKVRNMDQALREASAASAAEARAVALGRLQLRKGEKPPAGRVRFVTARAFHVDGQHIPGAGDGSITVQANEDIHLPEGTALSLAARGLGRVIA